MMYSWQGVVRKRAGAKKCGPDVVLFLFLLVFVWTTTEEKSTKIRRVPSPEHDSDGISQIHPHKDHQNILSTADRGTEWHIILGEHDQQNGSHWLSTLAFYSGELPRPFQVYSRSSWQRKNGDGLSVELLSLQMCSVMSIEHVNMCE